MIAPPTRISRPTVLLVDDTPENIDVLTQILDPLYKTKIALSGEHALKIAAGENKPDLILLDIMMPEMSGYDVCQRLKRNSDTQGIPVIFVTAMNEIEDERKGLDLGAVDYITKPVSPAIVLARVHTHLALYDQTRELERKVRQRTAELETTRQQIIHRLGRAAEFRDNETGNHIIRMSHYARLTAQALRLGEASVELLFHVAPMHDIGKIGIPDNILLKPGKLDAVEWEVMRQHPVMGAEILGEHINPLLHAAREVALTHHEKWDGTGYPQGLRGQEIPLFGRIVAIADVFDALTSVRPYKTAWTIEEAMREIENAAGRHFDPGLIGPFKSAQPAILAIKERYSEER
jgi:putative two-component system response regulator